MGKIPVQQCQHLQNEDEALRFFCHRCLVGTIQICQGFDLKCTIILVLSLSIFVFAFFWALPLHPVKTGLDAKDAIKLGAVSLLRLFFHASFIIIIIIILFYCVIRDFE